MASWKEKGVVPDSDDEEDWDSQSTTGKKDQGKAGELGDEFRDIDDILKDYDEGQGTIISREGTPPKILVEEDLLPSPIDLIPDHIYSLDETIDHPASVESPFNSFRHPRPASAPKDGQKQIPEEHESPQALPRPDDISRSWFHTGSPASSILSSPPDSPKSATSRGPDDARTENPAPTSSRNFIQSRDVSPAPPESTWPRRRQFRERKPVQIHPFLVEQMRYEKKMKESHIRPLKIVPSQERSNRRPHTADGDSQDTIFQEDGEIGTGESQSVDIDRSSPPPSGGMEILEKSILNEDSIMRDGNNEDSDEEFPDLHDLLTKKKSIFSRSKQPKTYSTKNQRKQLPQLPKINTKPAETSRQEPDGFDVFDFPFSPPTLSSPPIRSAASRRIRAISISSRDSLPPGIDQSSPSLQLPAEVVTPATSIARVAPNSSMDSVFNINRPPPIIIPSSPSSSSASSPSDDESITIRKLGKKIRGVLPASHLRLDAKKKQPVEQRGVDRDFPLASPSEFRPGVARTIKRVGSLGTPTQSRFSLPLSDSEESDHATLDTSTIRTQANSLFPESRMGFAIEDDRIDAMLPSMTRKRKSKHSHNRSGIKRVPSSSSFRERQGSHQYQPRITEHLSRATTTAHKIPKPKKKRQKTSPPRLSILDIVDTERVPQFMKIAARNARSRRDLGRQRPEKKFIRLATRGDTADAQSVLEEWKKHKIRPRVLPYKSSRLRNNHRTALDEISDNYQTTLPSPLMKVKPRAQHLEGASNGVRRIHISRKQQKSISDFVTPESVIPDQTPRRVETTLPKPVKTGSRRQNPQYEAPAARLAQLEASEVEYSRKFPAAAFKTTKKVLDALYRRGRKQPAQQNNLQLSRFLADDDEIRPTIESAIEIEDSPSPPPEPEEDLTLQLRRRKRSPKRLDAGAVVYRQPTEPLILDFFVPAHTEIEPAQGKLLGLGKFGTRYPSHFDIFPLQSGIFFHGSTFIGSGRLSKAITGLLEPNGEHTCFKIDEQVFRWESWDENVSSEMGVCFDWIFEQLTTSKSLTVDLERTDAVTVMNHIIDYVQRGIYFVNSQELYFCQRMLEILQDFSSRLELSKNTEGTSTHDGIEVTARLAVLANYLLRISRMQDSQSSYEVEATLQNISRCCINLLLSRGLDDVRKMYDDLQYLSIRDSGIRKDQYIAQAWVIMIKVLTAAKIPRASFWDLINLGLTGVDVNLIDDARVMEKLWYSIFTLLPLCEFDEFGVVVPGLRQTSSLDNWSLSQKLLKRVFALYKSDARQSPSFNDYCRAIVSRCHHLMLEWGWWKCSGLIGTIFDFFASQKLAHLRNEEVYKSPRFLEELDIEPSLAVEPEDRCFHIFLKIVALAIKHMREAGDTKGIRNLVTRILPNHDRQYPKEEAIRQRDLASLRNHHDLLCTMYWAAPLGQGPSLGLLQKLVAADCSHNEAFLINLRSWTNLARFLLSHSPLNLPTDALRSLVDWQNCFFSSLLQDYLQAESQVQKQVDSLLQSSRTPIFESHFKSTVDNNRRSTMSCIQAVSRAMIEATRTAHPITVRKALNLDILAQMFASHPSSCDMDRELVSSGIEVLQAYLAILSKVEPRRTSSTTNEEEEDSQGFLYDPDLEDDMERIQFVEDCVQPLDKSITLALGARIHKILYEEPSQEERVKAPFLKRALVAWAGLAALFVRYEIFTPQAFLVRGTNAIFQHRHKSKEALVSWSLFLGEFLQETGSLHLNVPGFDVGLEWIVVLSTPQKFLRWENLLTYQLLQKEHFLLKGQAFKDNRSLMAFIDQTPTATKNQQLIQAAIVNMQSILADRQLLVSTFGSVPRSKIKESFAGILMALMSSMQHNLQFMQATDHESHKSYVLFVQGIASQIHSHCKDDICALTDFFFQHSVEYWPEERDPTLYLAGLTSYTLQLPAKIERTKTQLFYYLWNGLKKSLSSNDAVETYISRIIKAAHRWDFLEFLLVEIAPAALQLSFANQAGWLVCEVYLVAISKSLAKVLSSDIAELAITYTTVLLKQILNGLSSLYVKYGHSIEGIHPNHQGTAAAVCRFWRQCSPLLHEYNISHENSLAELLTAYNKFVDSALIYFQHGIISDFTLPRFEVGRVGNSVAFNEMTRDVEKSWRMDVADGNTTVRSNEGEITLEFHRGPRNLGEIFGLGGGVYRYGSRAQVSQGLTNELLDDVFF